MAEEQSQEVDSSPASEETQIDESTTTEEVEEDTASSSDATEAEAETTETLADAVQDAFNPPEEPVEEAETTEETTEVAESIETSEETPSEDYKDVPFNKHPRFRKLVAEKNELKELAEQLKNDSDQFAKITGFIERNNLTAKEAVEGFKIMSAIRNDPNQAYKMLGGHLNHVSKLTGRVLPEDIQAKVDDGFIDEDAARELSQARANLAREQALRKQDAARSRGQNIKTQSDLMGQTLQTWGETTLAKDPDFSLKQDEFNDRVIALVSERGRPENQAEVMSIVEDAYGTVNERFKARQPQPTQLRTATGGKLSGAPRTEAKSLSDAITMAYEES